MSMLSFSFFSIHSEFLDIWDVDMVKRKEQINKQQHHTGFYNSDNLIVRRGQEFQVKITFNRPYKPAEDQFAVEFVIGEHSALCPYVDPNYPRTVMPLLLCHYCGITVAFCSAWLTLRISAVWPRLQSCVQQRHLHSRLPLQRTSELLARPHHKHLRQHGHHGNHPQGRLHCGKVPHVRRCDDTVRDP